MKPVSVAVMTMALLLGTTSSFAATPNFIGVVKAVDGDVQIIRNRHALRATPQFLIFQGDEVQTGTNGKVGLVLEDDTVISMGNDSRLVLTRFMFEPQEKKLSFLARFLQGTLSLISGQIAKLAPYSVHIETPQAAIAVRGSHVLVKVD